jgi:cell division protein FtsW
MAIGSGGIFGLGLGKSRLKHLYVSEPQNDFIFTIVCEELGFFGALAVLALFTLLVIRGFAIGGATSDRFSSLLGTGLTAKVAIQVLLNIGVVTNALPNTGISLPFFSYGGSSLLMLFAEMGILLSLSRDAHITR